MEVAIDLGEVTAVFVVIAFLFLVLGFAKALAGALNVGFLGIHPFASIATAIENHIISWLNSTITSLTKVAVGLLSGLLDTFAVLIAPFLILGLGIKAALEYLWHKQLDPEIHRIVNAATRAFSTVAHLERYVQGEVNAAIDAMIAAIKAHTSAVYQTLHSEFTEELQTQVRGIDEALRGIPSSVDQAIEHALAGLSGAGDTAAEQLAKAAEAAAANAEAAAQSASDEIRGLLDNVNTGDVAGAIGAVALLRTLVQTIESESGLDRAECRAKVKGICGTNPSQWFKMLALLGITLEWPGIEQFARDVAEVTVEISDAIKDLAA